MSEDSASIPKKGDNSGEYDSGNGGNNNGSTNSGKRRTKASRACDQCRKRKIRCDYVDDKGICTSCTKNGENCAFERVPLKRGPSKGAFRGHGSRSSMSSENISASSSVVGGSEVLSASERQGSVLLPPLTQYLPQPGPLNMNIMQQQQQQQPFWKVPYHEFQSQRRGSIDSLSSDISMRSINNTPQEPLFYLGSSGGQQGPTRTATNFNQNGTNGNGDGTYSHGVSFRTQTSTPSSPSLQQQQQQQYSYSKVNNSFGQYGTSGFISRHGSVASEGISPGASVSHQSVPMHHSNSNNNNSLPINKSQVQQAFRKSDAKPTGFSVAQIQVDSAAEKKDSAWGKSSRFTKRRRIVGDGTNKLGQASESLMAGDNLVSSAGFVFGQIPDVQLMDAYYEFIHTGFPIIPLNKETVTNEILLINTQPISPIHEINNYVILWFRNSLELLVRISLKRKIGNFSDKLTRCREGKPSNEIVQISNVGDGIDSSYDNLEIQGVLIAALNECLQKIVDIHPSLRENKNEISPKIKIIYLCTFVLLNYILALVGYDNSFVLGMSVTIFKDFKMYELLLYDDADVVFMNTDNPAGPDVNNNNNNNNNVNDVNEINDVNDDNDNGNDNDNCNNNRNDNDEKNPNNDNNSNCENSENGNNNTITNNKPSSYHNYDYVTDSGIPTTNDDSDERLTNMKLDQAGYSVTFKRLYVLLIIFDSLQCCSFGGPKLLNVPVEGASERFFRTKNNSDSKWVVDRNSTRMEFILQSVKLGELLTEVMINRRSICDVSCKQLNWGLSGNILKSIGEERKESCSLAHSFSAFILSRKKFMDFLLNLQNFETGELCIVDMELCDNLSELLCQLTSIILQILTIIMRTNPKNHIDYNYRPIRPLEQQNCTNLIRNQSPTDGINSNKDSGNDFYQKLLGLQDNAQTSIGFLKGTISPYCKPILREIQNIIELIKKMPTSLIGTVMICAGMQQNVVYNNKSGGNNNDRQTTIVFKSQEMVVKLSNCMNDMMQITSLLNMIKPVGLANEDSDNTCPSATITATRTISKYSSSNNSAMQRLYSSKNRTVKKKENRSNSPSPLSSEPSLQPYQLQEITTTLRSFVIIGWKLLDDFEMGWS